jgi:membrane fusion protein, heavy metal efflux system
VKTFLYSTILIAFLSACTDSKQETQPESAPVDENTVTLSAKQYAAAGIEVAALQRQKVNDAIQANGMIDVPPQSMVVISPPIGGFVRNTVLKEGMKVRKGDVLVSLENMEFIQIQQDYLESRSKLEFLEAEYLRQEELAKENINSGKAAQQARSNYSAMSATVKALGAKLKMININPESLINGEIQPFINVYSPIDGYVSSVHVNLGQFSNPTDPMFKIVNLDHVHVLLYIYEKDLPFIREGQTVRFRLGSDNSERFADIYLIGKEITEERTIHVHCHLRQDRQKLLPGMFVSATIEVEERETDVLPSDAVLTFADTHVVFASTGKEREFRMMEVKPGKSAGQYTEVVFNVKPAENTNFVVSGADRLLGVLKNSGGEE